MSDRVPRPQRVLPDRADDAVMRAIADAFQTAAAVLGRLTRRPKSQHDIGSR
jgi:hypothetical protein